MAARRATTAQSIQPSPSATALPDFTFITNSIAASNFAANNVHVSQRGDSGGGLDGIADGVMQKVAQEMGLLDTEELQIFEQYTKLPPT
jgi:hypothetical protein